MLRTQVQLTEEQAAALKRLAAQERLSISELIRRGVDLVLRAGGAGSHDKLRARAVSISGRFRSGHPDLSTTHDEHLVDTYSR